MSETNCNNRLVSRTVLHRMGYRKNPAGVYTKKRKNKIRLVQVRIFVEMGRGVTKGMASLEDGCQLETTSGISTIGDLIEWERFALCG